MTKDIENLKENIDAWIKNINQKLIELEELPSVVNGIVDDIQHNYELIYELKDEIEELKGEINTLKLLSIINFNKQKGYSIMEAKKRIFK